MGNKNVIKRTRFFFSPRKEQMWLEEMSEQGWFFTNITWGGMRYTFEKGEPQKMVYEVDRFDLPKNPRLSEIKAKKEFFELAEELGWKEVTHDIDMNYYFAKEWEEDGINELYDTEEMRRLHGDKYYRHYVEVSKQLDYMALFIGMLGILLSFWSPGYLMFALGYLLFAMGYGMAMEYFGRLWRSELSVSAGEWMKNHHEVQQCKEVKRLFFSSKSLEKYLTKMSRQGWHVKKITNFRYYFEKGEPRECYYVIDSKASVTARLGREDRKRYEDSKDIMLQNNDWQYRSVEEAEEVGWNYLCASGNLLILYSRTEKPSEAQTLFTKRSCLHPWLTIYGFCFCVGAVVGYVVAAIF